MVVKEEGVSGIEDGGLGCKLVIMEGWVYIGGYDGEGGGRGGVGGSGGVNQ